MLPMVLALAGLGPGEWIVVILVLVLLFGAAKIPELARSLGRAKSEFEKGAREDAAPKAPETMEDEEAQRVLKAAQDLGIPTAGRSLADIKAELRAKLA